MSSENVSPEQVVNNTGRGRFELPVGDRLAFMNYRVLTQGELGLIHTEVPEELSGQGIGSTLVEGVMEIVREKGWSVLPYCPFVHGWMKRHPQHADLISYRYPKRDEIMPEPEEPEEEEEGAGGEAGEAAGVAGEGTPG